MNQFHPYPGLFISFEGIDGAGKSSHIDHACHLLEQKFPTRKVVRTREPGGTLLGERLREVLLTEQMDLETEVLLMFAARNEHIKQVIEPTLKNNGIVVTDRFTDASYAYQVGGRGLNRNKLKQIENWTQLRNINGKEFLIQPNLTFLFDLPPDIAEQRRSNVRHPDKFESLNSNFFQDVRKEYLLRASEMPKRFITFNSLNSIKEIQNQIEILISNL